MNIIQARFFNKKSSLALLFISCLGLHFSVHAAAWADRLVDDNDYLNMGGHLNRYGYGPAQKMGRQMQHAIALGQMLGAITKLEKSFKGAVNAAAEQKKELAREKALENLYVGLEKMTSENEFSSKIGRVMANALSGGKIDESVDGVIEGVQLGVAMRLAKACGDVFGKRVDIAMDYVLGGALDTIGSFAQTCGSLLIHNSKEPFNIKELVGLRELLRNSFDDIETLLKDGLKDSLRGTDSALRQQGDQDVVPETPGINAWQILINGYIRQMDYCIGMVDEHSAYYSSSSLALLFYAGEFKQRIIDTQHLLKQGKTLKEFDASIESNKALIKALRKNTDNVLQRLIDQVDPRSVQGYKGSTGSTAASDVRARKGSHGDDDDNFPHSFRGW